MSLKNENLRIPFPSYISPRFEPRIELISNREAVIEGCAGIVEYNDTVACINCKKITVTFEGFGINLKALSDDSVSVCGTFTGISFSSQ